MVDVFISYKRDERDRAEPIARKLQALGLDVWFDARIPSGASFDREIESALKNAKSVLVLWSPASVQSDWVRNEASMGKESGVLVAIMLSPCELPVAFRSTQYEAVFQRGFHNDHPGWIKVVERIKDLAGKREQVERELKRQLFRRKRKVGLLWFLAWPLGALLLATAVGLATASYEITPQSGSFYTDSWDRGYFAARGSWELEGGPLASSVNQVEITCQAEEGYCLEARAEIYRDGRILNVGTDRRPVISWDKQTIVTRNEAGCSDYMMTINRASESLTALDVRRQTPAANTPPLVDCNLLEPRKEFRLVDGGRRALNAIGDQTKRQLGILVVVLVVWTLFVGWRIFRLLRLSTFA